MENNALSACRSTESVGVADGTRTHDDQNHNLSRDRVSARVCGHRWEILLQDEARIGAGQRAAFPTSGWLLRQVVASTIRQHRGISMAAIVSTALECEHCKAVRPWNLSINYSDTAGLKAARLPKKIAECKACSKPLPIDKQHIVVTLADGAKVRASEL
jgi:hypothetical protein